ncbi:hypothetical protein F441_10975 [Phytophthora nicotianae CJ01A1]|uniref:RxLR effector protein n=3 Tax=Phytophthora nicotianae TaxID=4792 RepID=W2Q3K0_PHYN3|nr:hypothetical protein PPTG_23166 [Phytophthora nicotianae INRA-310]ETK84222.1 hypothetical protein L915_10785 [Phytophthora nicotianae]ETN07742.1 hypothetical protein PPTG_23166 [Phytophthora nicotianae INRA-310]ETP14030.1 hypothetical protein F441_10975 [Phytophthora nicotianae CJ01A1]
MRLSLVLLSVVVVLLSSSRCDAKSLRQDSPYKTKESAENEERRFIFSNKINPEAVPIKSSKWNNALTKVLKSILPHKEGILVHKGNDQWSKAQTRKDTRTALPVH